MRKPSRFPIEQVFVLVRTLEFEVAVLEEAVPLRLEIFRSITSKTLFRVRLWRLEHFRIQSTFPQKNGRPMHHPSDELILKEFESMESAFTTPHRARSAQIVERKIVAEVAAWASKLRRSSR